MTSPDLLEQATTLLAAARGADVDPAIRLAYLAAARAKVYAAKDIVDSLELSLKAMEVAFAKPGATS
jgi:hypothetical protein